MMVNKTFKRLVAPMLVTTMLVGSISVVTSGIASAAPTDSMRVTKLSSIEASKPNKDGGVAEIVAYNPENQKLYLVNGSSNPATLDIVKLGAKGELTKEKSINIKEMVDSITFTYGDLTSVVVSTINDRIYVAAQEKDANKEGRILILDYAGNLITQVHAGVQPDMITVSKNGRYVLTANEGEPRVKGIDPQGSITILDTFTGFTKHLLFDNPSIIDDSVHIRGASGADGQITSKGTKADAIFDLEPEYITIAEDQKTAFVSLQENNAIATIDLPSKSIVSVKGLGLKDYNLPTNALDLVKDSVIKLENVPFVGVKMPDGIASYSVNGKTYVLSANEGDATEWDGRINASKVSKIASKLPADSAAATFLKDKTVYNDVEVLTDFGTDKVYMYGGRSFSIYEATGMKEVYDSGNDFESITAERLPKSFNASHSKTAMDDRSTKKGPEPEGIEIGKVGNATIAFIGLERIGGVMMYDVTNPTAPKFVNYTNTRDFTTKDNLNTDTGPEGLDFIPAAGSPTGFPLLLVANEVGGTITVLQLHSGETQPAFRDVPVSLTNEVTALVELEIIKGDGKGKLNPDRGITPSEFKLMLARTFGSDIADKALVGMLTKKSNFVIRDQAQMILNKAIKLSQRGVKAQVAFKDMTVAATRADVIQMIAAQVK
ncbi:MAG: hypothetical protein RLZZ267_1508 [Bacillota bacterium]|jgi:DNA-binding beta-propeller fold protein YncE